MLTYNFDDFIHKAETQSNGQPNIDTLIIEYEELIATKPKDSAELLALESQRVKFENKHYKNLAVNPQTLIQRWNVLKDKIPVLWNKDFTRETEEYRKNFFKNMSSYSRETSSEMSNTLVKMYQERAKYDQNARTISQIAVTLMNLLKRLKEYDLAIDIGNHLSQIRLPVHTGKEFNERVKDLQYHQDRE